MWNFSAFEIWLKVAPVHRLNRMRWIIRVNQRLTCISISTLNERLFLPISDILLKVGSALLFGWSLRFSFIYNLKLEKTVVSFTYTSYLDTVWQFAVSRLWFMIHNLTFILCWFFIDLFVNRTAVFQRQNNDVQRLGWEIHSEDLLRYLVDFFELELEELSTWCLYICLFLFRLVIRVIWTRSACHFFLLLSYM